MQYRRMLIRIRNFCVAICVIACFVTYVFTAYAVLGIAHSDSSRRGFIGQISSEKVPVQIQISGYKLIIPRNCLNNYTQNPAEFFVATFTLPDMIGFYEETVRSFREKSSVANWFMESDSHIVWAYPVVNESSVTQHWNEPSVTKSRSAESESFRYGLTRVLENVGYDTYVAQHDREDVVIKCRHNARGSHTTCDVEFDLAPGLAIHYGYGYARLAQWYKIDVEIKKLFQSFLEK